MRVLLRIVDVAWTRELECARPGVSFAIVPAVVSGFAQGREPRPGFILRLSANCAVGARNRNGCATAAVVADRAGRAVLVAARHIVSRVDWVQQVRVCAGRAGLGRQSPDRTVEALWAFVLVAVGVEIANATIAAVVAAEAREAVILVISFGVWIVSAGAAGDGGLRTGWAVVALRTLSRVKLAFHTVITTLTGRAFGLLPCSFTVSIVAISTTLDVFNSCSRLAIVADWTGEGAFFVIACVLIAIGSR